MKLCIDCKHIIRSEVFPENHEYSKCGVSGEVSLVSGQRVPEYCTSARREGQPCGPRAMLFVPSRIPDHRDGYARTTYDDRMDTAPDGRALWKEK